MATKSITENGTYNASSDNVDGYSQVNVNVSGGGDVPVIHELTAGEKITKRIGYYFEIGNTVFVVINCFSEKSLITNDTIFSGLPLPDYNSRFPCSIFYNNITSSTTFFLNATTGILQLTSGFNYSNIFLYGSFFYKKAVAT